MRAKKSPGCRCALCPTSPSPNDKCLRAPPPPAPDPGDSTPAPSPDCAHIGCWPPPIAGPPGPGRLFAGLLAVSGPFAMAISGELLLTGGFKRGPPVLAAKLAPSLVAPMAASAAWGDSPAAMTRQLLSAWLPVPSPDVEACWDNQTAADRQTDRQTVSPSTRPEQVALLADSHYQQNCEHAVCTCICRP